MKTPSCFVLLLCALGASAQQQNCAATPTDAKCADYTPANAQQQLDSICTAQNNLPACSIYGECKKDTTLPQSVCSPAVLLATACTRDNVTAADACSEIKQLCGAGTAVKLCSQAVPAPSAKDASRDLYSACSQMPEMKSCTICPQKPDATTNVFQCNVMSAYSALCNEMGTHSECANWKSFCQATNNFKPYCSGAGSSGGHDMSNHNHNAKPSSTPSSTPKASSASTLVSTSWGLMAIALAVIIM
ncbi:uncharacterized protein VTP21DRAFT_4127 [Calcarisporiella thermophila]|uniref:uncharacterized protein n=1 Tax=Calcarisporiella thermophila TaxID=911321 RepID=UPI003741F8C4